MEENDILSIKWKDFHENTKFGLGSLKENQDFTDVSLVSEDGLQVEAHKVILAASSPFFRDLLGRNARSDAFIYMRGATSTDMISIVDFLYYGEVQVHQDNLRGFLTMATELRLEGLFDDGDGAQAKTSKILSEGNITRIKTVTRYSGQSAQNKMEKANNSIKDEKTSQNICALLHNVILALKRTMVPNLPEQMDRILAWHSPTTYPPSPRPHRSFR